jgi:UDP-N-acetyl-alpha-D-muramoyl-L-alanyl-L-glutamate epimerase
MSAQPSVAQAFRFADASFEGDTAILRYALDDGVEFVERIRFPGARGEPSNALLELLQLVVGVSYYKTVAPLLEADADPATAALLNRLYVDGLSEFAYVNGIDLRERVRFWPTREIAADAPSLARRTAVPIGGGKDSIVTLDALRRAGEPIVAFSVGNPDPIRRTVEAAGAEHIVVERELSPNLAELNAAGALNGHVPITAIVSAIACFAAPLYGFDAVAMSNERSASEPNLVWNGLEVNHQWSKGLQFERLFQASLADRAPGLEWFSLLRPWSELAIARAFARLDGYDDAFTSCNSVFRRDPARRGAGWCGDCPKCRFVFLVLAPWMEPERLVRIFGRNLLDEPEQTGGFAELMGEGIHKPLECVGEGAESAAALSLLRRSADWRDTQVVRALGAATDLERWLEPSPDHCIPPRFEGAARALL